MNVNYIWWMKLVYAWMDNATKVAQSALHLDEQPVIVEVDDWARQFQFLQFDPTINNLLWNLN